MKLTYSYCRVLSNEDAAERQQTEIKNAGFLVEEHQMTQEDISCEIAASRRPKFNNIKNKMVAGDTLVVTKLDRLGRSASDICETIDYLIRAEVHLYCLALGVIDLTSPAGKIRMQVMYAMEELENNVILEKIICSKAKVKRVGRPPSLTQIQQVDVHKKFDSGYSVSTIARIHKTSRQTIMRIRDSSYV